MLRGGRPGLFVTGELGCTYLGVDASPASVAVARRREPGMPGSRLGSRSRRIPPVPPGRFDVVLLLETLLAFRDKRALV